MQVQDPSGHTWRVSRRWVPWPRHAQHHGFPDAERPERSSGATVLTVLLVMLIFVVPVLTLAVLVALPLLLLLLLVPLASLVRIPWGKHWYVEVFQDKEPLVRGGRRRLGVLRPAHQGPGEGARARRASRAHPRRRSPGRRLTTLCVEGLAHGATPTLHVGGARYCPDREGDGSRRPDVACQPALAAMAAPPA